MADPHVLSALQDKAHELRQAIVSYEEHLDRARHELAVVTAALTIFERDGGRITDARPSHVRNLFKRGEVIALCRTALAAEPDGMTTRELAVACLGARGFDRSDPVLVRAMVGLLRKIGYLDSLLYRIFKLQQSDRSLSTLRSLINR